MKKFIMFIGILLLIFIGFIIFDSLEFEHIPVLDIEDSNMEINKLYIYGTHLNIEGDYTLDSDSELVLYNGDFLAYKVNVKDGKFNLSDYVNDGIYLDDIPKGKYYLFELDDCSLPGISSGTLKYLGTKTDFKKLLQ